MLVRMNADVSTEMLLIEAEKAAIQADFGVYYYDTSVRTYYATKPMLKCNGIRMNKFGDDTTMYVGTLTADEVIYAGMTNPEWFAFPDYTNFLQNDYTRINNDLGWWTFSPVMYEDGATYVWYVSNYGQK